MSDIAVIGGGIAGTSTAVELAEDVGVTQQAAHSKLSNLEDRGLVRSKEVGSRARVWWITDEGRRAYDDSG